MSYQITLLPSLRQFDCQPGETILQSALKHDIAFPNRCQVGVCAMCLCRLKSGQVRYQLEPMLTKKEQEEGWIFACQAEAVSDLVLTL
ncbi:2Fe-2S iron-sulfur cluster binding domain-containing protein [Vibrio sp. SM6]|uniref:2Fe-2S iron-sulfur cluster binding domain-containing protein n=1 Tax=Vibrio agarilyticus TaxID=2726741 RepID=A0A7X8TTS5_9VIBR|nr:2Fe-2S iron-sulfur cluster-binding protein [Vibrio agarilyticus]NLS14772.1 2Fe-2S iron-sulfur cluster binding domain-containing protein [Vibrio agarilyticus]